MGGDHVEFLRGRYAAAGSAIGIVLAFAGATQLGLFLFGGGRLLPAAVGALQVPVGISGARRSLRAGVLVSEEGLRLRSGLGFGAHGTFGWDEIQKVTAYRDPSIRNAAEQVALVTRSGEIIPLGRLPGRARLVDAARRQGKWEDG